MEFCRNVSVPGDSQPKLGGFASNSLDELFSIQKPEADVSMEWLSVFVEDCLSSKGNTLQVQTLPPPSSASVPSKTPNKPSSTNLSALHKIVVSKARSKRKRIAAAKTKNNPFLMIPTWPNHSSDPLLLHQSHWLADSELIQPKKQEQEQPKTSTDMASSPAQCDAEEETEEGKEDQSEEIGGGGGGGAGQQGAGRRCTHCLSQRTPQWRAGPMGPKTLCNACGVRYKSGRLLPEYRPAKSPTFVSYLHSNSHKKVMEMRSSNVSPISPSGERRR